MWRIRTILHPHDLETSSRAAFEAACALSRDYQALLIVLHVYPTAANGADAIAREQETDLEFDLLEKLRLVTPHDASMVVEYRLREGSPTQWILETASSCDLIVMGTHGRSGIGRAIMGSVAEQVLREASCPVMVVRPTAALPAEATTRTVGQNTLDSGM